jgi:hypothetical protein
MTPDQPALEARLRDLHAVALDESFLDRLEAAADGTWTTLSPQEISFEHQLRKISPVKLGPEFMAELEKIVRDVPFHADEKIVHFPTKMATSAARRQRPIWGAAAAVALIGAATALMMPSSKSPDNKPRPVASASKPGAGYDSQNFIPASFNRNLSAVHDEGVIWKSNKQPHSVVRVIYKDQVTLKDANGRIVQVVQPRVEYMLVPAKAD